MLYSISRLLLIPIFKILFRFQTKGREYIPKKGGFILASNHLSYLDPILLGIACPRKLNFMARHDLFFNPLFSWLLSAVEAFPVKRDSADLSALKEAIRRVNNGDALVLFPEGSRSPNGTITQPQAGIGFLAAKLNVPVIPAFIKGTDRALPKSAKFIRLHKISVCFGKPRIIPEGFLQGKEISVERRLPYQDIAIKIMEDIRRLSCSVSS